MEARVRDRGTIARLIGDGVIYCSTDNFILGVFQPTNYPPTLTDHIKQLESLNYSERCVRHGQITLNFKLGYMRLDPTTTRLPILRVPSGIAQQN